jgi:hypothetical protein
MRIVPQSHVDGFGLSSSFIVAELTLPCLSQGLSPIFL